MPLPLLYTNLAEHKDWKHAETASLALFEVNKIHPADPICAKPKCKKQPFLRGSVPNYFLAGTNTDPSKLPKKKGKKYLSKKGESRTVPRPLYLSVCVSHYKVKNNPCPGNVNSSTVSCFIFLEISLVPSTDSAIQFRRERPYIKAIRVPWDHERLLSLL